MVRVFTDTWIKNKYDGGRVSFLGSTSTLVRRTRLKINRTLKDNHRETLENVSQRIFPIPLLEKRPYRKGSSQHGIYRDSRERNITNDEFHNVFTNDNNAGLWCGKESGVTVIDLDRGIFTKNNPSLCNKEHVEYGFETDSCNCLLGKAYEGLKTLEIAQVKEVALSTAYKVQTPSGGLHLYFKYSPDYQFSNYDWKVQSKCKHCADYTGIVGVDIRNSNNKYIVLPYSQTIKGEYKPLEDSKFSIKNMVVMPKELIDFLNTGVINSHSSKGHRGTRVERAYDTNTYDYAYADKEEFNEDKRPLSDKSKYSYDLSNKNPLGFSFKEHPDEIKYRKDRYYRRKAFTDIGKRLARFDNDYGLAVLGGTKLGKQFIQRAQDIGANVLDSKIVNKVLREGYKILKKLRREPYIEHPITGEIYHKVGNFFIFLDTEGSSGRYPIPRADFTLDDKVVNKEKLMTVDNFGKWVAAKQNKRKKQIDKDKKSKL